jgi:hypothetical protein
MTCCDDAQLEAEPRFRLSEDGSGTSIWLAIAAQPVRLAVEVVELVVLGDVLAEARFRCPWSLRAPRSSSGLRGRRQVERRHGVCGFYVRIWQPSAAPFTTSLPQRPD